MARTALLLGLLAMGGVDAGIASLTVQGDACGVAYPAFDLVIGDDCPDAWPDHALLEQVDRAAGIHGARAIRPTASPAGGIAVVDRGFDEDHPALDGIRLFHWSDGAIVPGPEADTDGDHGTKTASLAAGSGAGSERGRLAGIAPDAPLYGIDISSRFTVSGAVAAFDWILRNHETEGIRVVLNAWTREGADGIYDPDDPLARAAKRLADEGLLVVVAAGNQAGQAMMSAALVPEVLTVGSTTGDGAVTPFSNQGPPLDKDRRPLPWVKPDIVALGSRVWTAASPDGGSILDAPRYASASGTSMAAAIAAGAGALLARPDVSGAEVHAALRAGAADLGAAGPDAATGWGMLDVPAAQAILAGASMPRGLVGAHDATWSEQWSLVGALVPLRLESAELSSQRFHVPVPPHTAAMNLDIVVTGAAPGAWSADAGFPGSSRIPFSGDGVLSLRVESPTAAMWDVRVQPLLPVYQADLDLGARLEMQAVRHGIAADSDRLAAPDANNASMGIAPILAAVAVALWVRQRR